MRATDLIIAGAGLALSVVGALKINLEKRDGPAVLKIDLQKQNPEVLRRSLEQKRRVTTVKAPDFNRDLAWLVQVDIGTPPQTVFVALDTGSSDLNVETNSSNICTLLTPNPCTQFGAYNANSSSTYKYIDSDFLIVYEDGEGARGDWVNDVVKIGGATLIGAQFGIQYKTTIRQGILGVGYETNEARVQRGEQYPNLPSLLVHQGWIASRAFSIWTNDDRSASGTLLFGGIDTSKFSCELVTIDLVVSGSNNSTISDFSIPVAGITGTDANGNTVTVEGGATPFNAVMDSGTTFGYFPTDLAQSIWTSVGAQEYSPGSDIAYVLCSIGQGNETVNLAFKGIAISVPLSQLAIFPDENHEFCVFGIGKALDGPNLIGDTLLAGMYVVFDIDNNQISIAPTVFNSTAPEHILPIKAGSRGVPKSHKSLCPGVTPVVPSTCHRDSCLRAIVRASATDFCASYQSGGRTAIPTAIAKGCQSLESRISSGCACYAPVTATTASATSSPSIPPVVTPMVPLDCSKNSCLRAVERLSASEFCSAYITGAPTAVPTAIVKGCETSTFRSSSACRCLPQTV